LVKKVKPPSEISFNNTVRVEICSASPKVERTMAFASTITAFSDASFNQPAKAVKGSSGKDSSPISP
jgi:hypothetical protein